ncbi:MAG: hypothetical protein OEY21_10600, partial [Nitrospira sp.]|nr:hypothetical protein [Nitrospira sp.]
PAARSDRKAERSLALADPFTQRPYAPRITPRTIGHQLVVACLTGMGAPAIGRDPAGELSVR